MTRKDYLDLLEVSDGLEELDDELKILSGVGHGSGKLLKLDKVYDVLLRHSRRKYRKNEDGEALFYRIVCDRSKTIEDRADLLMKIK